MTVNITVHVTNEQYRALSAIAKKKKTEVNVLIEMQIARGMTVRQPRGVGPATSAEISQMALMNRQGMSDRQIALELGMSNSTVSHHRIAMKLPIRPQEGK